MTYNNFKYILWTTFALFLLCTITIGCRHKKRDLKNIEKGYESWMQLQLSHQPEIPVINTNCKTIKVSNPGNNNYFLNPVKFVKLCPNTDVLIGTIDKVIPFGDKLYILDKLTNTIFILNDDGSFHAKIHKIGKSGDEFLKIGDFCLNIDEHQIIVFDVQQKKHLYYNFSGRFLKAYKSPIWLREYTKLDNGGYCLLTLGNNFSGFNLLLTDSLYQLKAKSVPTNSRYKLNLFSTSLMRKYKNEINFSIPFCDNIYTVKNDSLLIKYHLDFKNNGFKYSLKKHITMNKFRNDWENSQNESYVFYGDYIENETDALFGINGKRSRYLTIYSKKTGEVSCVQPRLKNSFVLTFPQFIHDDYFVSVIDPEWMLRFKGNLIKEYNLNSFYQGLSDNSNPVLVYFKILE